MIRKKLALMSYAMLLIWCMGCGDIGSSSSGSDSGNSSNNTQKSEAQQEYEYWERLYNDWYKRETNNCQGKFFREYVSNSYTGIEDWIVDFVHQQVLTTLGRCYDSAKYWQSTCETNTMTCADCDNFATKIMMELREQKIPDNYLGVILARKKGEANKNQFHLMAVVFDPGSNYWSRKANYWILDNGTFESEMIRKKDFFNKYRDIEAVFGFNLFEFWRF